MGAYTFTAEPPFRITSISRVPIFSPGWYEGPWKNTRNRQKYIFFPTGYILVHRRSGEVVENIDTEDCNHSCFDLFDIVLSLGYNDIRGYVTTIHLRRLINTMRRQV
jgi:hypothetical protein